MNILDYVTFTKKATEHGVVHEHAEIPTFTLAYYFHVLRNPHHPEHRMVMEFADQIEARAREEKLAMGRELMNQTRAACSDEEWSMLVD